MRGGCGGNTPPAMPPLRSQTPFDGQHSWKTPRRGTAPRPPPYGELAISDPGGRGEGEGGIAIWCERMMTQGLPERPQQNDTFHLPRGDANNYAHVFSKRTQKYTHSHTYSHTSFNRHTHTHTHTHTHLQHTHAHTHLLQHTSTRTHTSYNTHTHTYIHTYIHTHIHTHTHLLRHTHLLQHTHIHICTCIHSHEDPTAPTQFKHANKHQWCGIDP